jgi:single-stranded-DNA-specific exonuclease
MRALTVDKSARFLPARKPFPSDAVATVDSMVDGGWTIAPCESADVRALADALGISEITAAVLVRRGFCDADEARAFLLGALPEHDPLRLGDMPAAVATIRAAIAAGKRICVHGDYDADGICATSLAVLLLQELGADVGWHLPSRFDEGYGLNGDTVERLAAEGVGLILTVDCGITAVAEVARAKELGVEVVVTDHHRPGETFPDCPVVATLKGDYPFPGLCGTGVVWKLAQALLGGGHRFLDEHLDLVAVATVADVVPLLDENRALALAGLKRLGRTQKPGLRALMEAARVDPATADEGSVGFRLAPRINAAGRLGKPQAALHLLLTDDKREAEMLARELEELNRERQAVEERILREAAAQIESWPEPKRRRRAYVVAGADWHEGVIGIVASRLVERYNRPVVLIAGAEPAWKGSGRSVGTFDLHGGLGACAEHLQRYGGHRAAAGLSILPGDVEAFADAFAAHADAVLDDAALAPVVKVDAVVPGKRLGLELCAELARLAPFGLGNPGVVLLAGGCELSDLGTVGEGKHLRFRVRDGGRDAGSAIAFGLGAQLDRFRRPCAYDVVFRLQENHWNGTVSPQLVVRRIFETPDAYPDLRDRFAAEFRAGPERWSAEAHAVFTELGLDREQPVWRSLLESERFRSLLVEPLPLAAAA